MENICSENKENSKELRKFFRKYNIGFRARNFCSIFCILDVVIEGCTSSDEYNFWNDPVQNKPYFDLSTTKTNISVDAGRTVYLSCHICNIKDQTVSLL